MLDERVGFATRVSTGAIPAVTSEDAHADLSVCLAAMQSITINSLVLLDGAAAVQGKTCSTIITMRAPGRCERRRSHRPGLGIST
ncbi:hypothetical protein [Streptomyces sp. x-80]|uniref:hypothetical protein n=1 Tax=Streptomyces sp. x-80 TaxID=2789282 RepID=UPI00398190A9